MIRDKLIPKKKPEALSVSSEALSKIYLPPRHKENNFSKRLIDMILEKEKRESLNDLNLSKLAKKVEIPPATFHQWLHGAFPKRIEHWIKLKKYFNCDLDYLITGVSIDKKAIPHEGKFIISDNGLDIVEWHYKVKKKLKIKVQ